jgi:hypothetical protein
MDRNPIFHDYAHHALLASISPTLALPSMVSQARPVDEYIRPDGGVRQMRPVYLVSTPTKSSGPFVSTPSGSASKRRNLPESHLLDPGAHRRMEVGGEIFELNQTNNRSDLRRRKLTPGDKSRRLSSKQVGWTTRTGDEIEALGKQLGLTEVIS